MKKNNDFICYSEIKDNILLKHVFKVQCKISGIKDKKPKLRYITSGYVNYDNLKFWKEIKKR